MSLDQKFQEACASVKDLSKRPTDNELLELYALFKQATDGDVNTTRPGMLDLKGKAKWDTWKAKQGMSKDSAKEAYIKMAETIVKNYK
ncbi:acyl-CoA-binding protein-like isoform X2 [Augochlora pura]